jgi:hypothetical protein
MRVPRRRLIMLGIVAATLVSASGVALTRGAHEPLHAVDVRSASPESTVDPSTDASTTAAASTSPATTTSIPALVPGTVAAAPPPPPWQASPTTGLTNLAPVTITAHDLPYGLYIVGQCPVTVQVPDQLHCSINGRPNFITVDDGMLRSTAYVYRWVGQTHFDCASAPGACAVGFIRSVPATGFAPVGFPISFDTTRPPRITVSPADHLTDGQAIEVRGVDVGQGIVEVDECLTLSWSGCEHAAVRSQPDGTFRLSLTVERDFTWGGHGPGSGSCDVDSDCVIVVWVRQTDSSDVTWSNTADPVVVHFAPGAPSPVSTTTTSPSEHPETTPTV